jgi:hypothetical protein
MMRILLTLILSVLLLFSQTDFVNGFVPLSIPFCSRMSTSSMNEKNNNNIDHELQHTKSPSIGTYGATIKPIRMMNPNANNNNSNMMTKNTMIFTSRRHFTWNGMIKTAMLGIVGSSISSIPFMKVAQAAPTVLTTTNGIKYAITKPADEKRTPLERDIVAVEYTGYLLDGSIFGTLLHNN